MGKSTISMAMFNSYIWWCLFNFVYIKNKCPFSIAFCMSVPEGAFPVPGLQEQPWKTASFPDLAMDKRCSSKPDWYHHILRSLDVRCRGPLKEKHRKTQKNTDYSISMYLQYFPVRSVRFPISSGSTTGNIIKSTISSGSNKWYARPGKLT